MNLNESIRQGDVLLLRVNEMPADTQEVAPDGNRIVLAYGEVTGHAHAIYDHVQAAPTQQDEARATEIAGAAIARAKLYSAANGDRYLQVVEPVTLKHEEHTAHTLPPGIYKLPAQVEYSPAKLLRVAD